MAAAEIKRLFSQMKGVIVFGVVYNPDTKCFMYNNIQDQSSLRNIQGASWLDQTRPLLRKSYTLALLEDALYKQFMETEVLFPFTHCTGGRLEPSLARDDRIFLRGLVSASNRTMARYVHLVESKAATAKKKKAVAASTPDKEKKSPAAKKKKAVAASKPDKEKKSPAVRSKKTIAKSKAEPGKEVALKQSVAWKTENKSSADPGVMRIKKSIPRSVRDAVWKRFVGGSSTSSVCQVCETSTISYLCGSGSKAIMGHVQAESRGGAGTVDNLRPICANCNSAMRTQNLFTFKATMFPSSTAESWIRIHGI